MKRLLFFLLITFGMVVTVNATHNRAGEITYRHISGLTYEITVTTYTKGSSTQADRCELEFRFGDGDIDTVQRINGPASNNCPNGGVVISPPTQDDLKKNIYQTTHTYPGPAIYVISVQDPNRNAGILNIPNSVNVTFYIESELYISAFAGVNNSPTLNNDPIDKGCVSVPYYHNPGAIDPDGDSLVYSFEDCLGLNGVDIFGYKLPDQIFPGPNNNISIDQNTGTVTWDSPQAQGEYNICIKIEEYRNGQKIGTVIRDMQITIGFCNNNPPFIEPHDVICVTAGDFLDLPIVGWDPDGDLVELTAVGEPLILANNPATFNQPVSAIDTVVENFQWQTDCDQIRFKPYTMTFKADDKLTLNNLVFFRTVDIRIVGPAVENPVATPQGNSMMITWDQHSCTNAVSYKIYRKADSVGFVPADCQLGVPASTGYSLIGTVNGLTNTSFVDNGGSGGLVHGVKYCYMIVACFPDGSVGYASVETCAELKNDIPVITRVTVFETDVSTGKDTITWALPTELDDSIQFTGPYFYRIYRTNSFGAPSLLAGQTGSSPNIATSDSIFVDSLLDTEGFPHTYRVELWSGTDSVGSSQPASSIFLSSVPNDNRLDLSWQENVPWTNYQYEVYRFNNGTNQFDLLDTVLTPNYLDSGLSNGTEYCYLIRSFGEYSGTGFASPLLNSSQIHCNIPIDLEPPCPPQAPQIFSDCNINENRLEWTNPNDVCADDVLSYNVYYSPVLGQPLEFLTSVGAATTTDITFDNLTSVAGCYAITAIDSFQNESVFSNVLCVDNCPEYELPNVFTPGGDGNNDFFVPFPYKFVESIDLEVFNRWGQLVYETTDPDIGWDGTTIDSGEQAPSGVYYYVCQVNEIRLTGIETRVLKGYVQLINQKEFSPNQ